MEGSRNAVTNEWTAKDFYHYTLMLAGEGMLDSCLKIVTEDSYPKTKALLTEVESNYLYLVERDVPMLFQMGVASNYIVVPFSKLKKTLEILRASFDANEMKLFRFWPGIFSTYEDFYFRYELSKTELFSAA